MKSIKNFNKSLATIIQQESNTNQKYCVFQQTATLVNDNLANLIYAQEDDYKRIKNSENGIALID